MTLALRGSESCRGEAAAGKSAILGLARKSRTMPDSTPCRSDMSNSVRHMVDNNPGDNHADPTHWRAENGYQRAAEGLHHSPQCFTRSSNAARSRSVAATIAAGRAPQPSL